MRIVFLLLASAVFACAQPAGYAGFNDPVFVRSTLGAPDVEDSTEHDKPKPKIPTRWVIYKKEGVKFVFAARSLRPTRWMLMGVSDVRTRKLLDLDVAMVRLLPRIEARDPAAAGRLRADLRKRGKI